MQWIFLKVRQLFTELSQLFTTPVFEIGSKHFSISSIATLILLGLIVVLMSRAMSQWLKRRLLQRFDRGMREAIAAIIGYLLSAFGLLVVLQSAGINLSSLTVLAGVLGIGFGFGLQNLASNFISGLTLLFEQPIKVGDFVEVDGLLGTVEKISIRSTIVRTPDDVFVIVPNLRFVEQNIINWSYHAPRCRIHIPVGVAYGSDSVLVTEALLATARMEPRVLSHPAPKVWFRGFGDSALNFELLVWIDKPQESEPIKSALNFLIEQELRQRRIAIPFPQRDLHITNLSELGQLLQRNSMTENGNGKVSDKDIPTIGSAASTKTVNNWTLRDLLRRVSYFDRCTDLELRQLIEYGYRQLFPSQQIICRENDPGESFYIILTGCVEVISQRTGKYIATLHEGEFFGEMSLLMGTPRTATVRTLEETTLFIIGRSDLQKLLMEHRQLADQIAEKLAERQQVLRDMGLMLEGNPEETPFIRIRKRIQTLFHI